MNRKKATFFGGAINKKDTPEYLQTVEIGQLLASKGYEVQNGGYFGLMEAVSYGASMVENTTITGYTVKTFNFYKCGNEYLTKNVPAEDVYDRLRYLIQGTDVFVLGKGGMGTLAELFLTLDVTRKMKKKPLVILVGKHFWRFMIQYLIDADLKQSDYDNLLMIDTVEELENLIYDFFNSKISTIFVVRKLLLKMVGKSFLNFYIYLLKRGHGKKFLLYLLYYKYREQ